jgi:hypothetical protein
MRIERNENTAELVGLSFGDGGLTYRKGTNRMRFQLCGSLKDDKEHYDNYIIPLFNKEVMFPIFKRKVGIIFNNRLSFYGISIESSRIIEELNNLGIPKGVKEELFIPEWIKSNKIYLARFLRGFLDTDGCVSCQKNYSIKNNKLHTQIRIYLVSTSKNLMEEICQSLKSLNIKCIFHHSKVQPNNKNNKDSYYVRVCGGIQVNQWFDIIGSNNPKHKTKYLIWKESGFCPPNTALEDRMKILKKEVSPYLYYERECQSGQMGMLKEHVA